MKFYFTFGSNHVTSKMQSLGYRYVVIEAEHEDDARNQMFLARGPKWSFCYTENSFTGQAETYGLREISLEDVRI